MKEKEKINAMLNAATESLALSCEQPVLYATNGSLQSMPQLL